MKRKIKNYSEKNSERVQILNFQKIRKNITIKVHGDCLGRNKRKNMSYRDLLREKINKLELIIANSAEEKRAVEEELNKLRLAEFEEDMRNESTQQLLKG